MNNFCLPPADVEVFVCFSQDDYRRAVKRGKFGGAPHWLEDAEACCHFFDKGKGGSVVVMCLDAEAFSRRTSIQVAALITHEAVHVMQECRRWMRESEPGIEWEAYTVQYVAQMAMLAYAEILEAA